MPPRAATGGDHEQIPAIEYLATKLEGAERRCATFKVRYTWSYYPAGSAEPRETADCMLAVQGNRSRCDEPYLQDPARLRYCVVTGDHARALVLDRRGQSLQPGMFLRGHRSQFAPFHPYETLASLKLGPKPMSVELRKRGVGAARQGNRWIVDLVSSIPGDRDIYVIRPDRDYRVAERRHYRGNRLLAVTRVTRWIGGNGKPWLPGVAVHRARPSEPETTSTMRIDVTEASIGEPLPEALFHIQDDGRTTLFDLDAQRVIRIGAPPRLDEDHLRRVLDAIRALPKPPFPLIAQSVKKFDAGVEGGGYCGLQCLWVLARLCGKPASWDPLYARHQNRDGEHSMEELRQAARSLGIETRGLEVPPGDFERLRLPCIGWTRQGGDRGHYYLIINRDGRSVHVYDPPSRVYQVPIKDMLTPEFWRNGYVLAPSAAP